MLPREIKVERGPEKSRFDLPTRNIGPLRFLGLVPMVFAVFFAWMPAGQMLRTIRELLAGDGSAFEWGIVVFLSVFVIAAMMPFGFGLFILAGRTRVTVLKDRIVTTEIAGPVRWSRKFRFDQIDRFEIGGAESSPESTPGPFRTMCGLTVYLKNDRKTPIAAGYPRDWLQLLAGEITRLMQRHGAAVAVQETHPIETDDLQPVRTEARLEKPVGSKIELSSTGWGSELKVPAGGLFKGSYGLVVFGTVWCIFVGVIGSAVFGKGGQSGGLGVLTLFFGIGALMLLLGIHLGTRRWTLKADHSQLHVTLKSALRSREWKWAANEIEDVRVGDSGTKVNERTLEQLQIHARNGRGKTGLLTGRTHEELAWIATTLRGILRAQSGESPEAPPRIDPSRRGS